MRFQHKSDGLHLATHRWTNVYLLTRGEESVLVDTGMDATGLKILHALDGHPPVQRILLTHAHFDHSGGAAALSAGLGVDVFAHPDDAALLRTGTWRRPGEGVPKWAEALFASMTPGKVMPLPNVRELTDAGPLNWPGAELFPLPGHSAGQVGFRLPRADGGSIWIVGDALMTLTGVSRPLGFESKSEGLASIRALAGRVAEGDLLCPGHGPPLRVSSVVQARLAKIATP
ncbi:MAG: MBL fold metallo-hydrolase [Pseudomonadota bacterium]